MFRVVKQINFCYGHRLLNYDGKCRFLHGHNAVAEVVLESDALDDRGMVADFGDIKRIVKSWIDEHLDHKMILNRADPMVPSLQAAGEAFFLIDTNPTAENIARLIYEFAVSGWLPVVEIRVWETPTSYATYGHRSGQGG